MNAAEFLLENSPSHSPALLTLGGEHSYRHLLDAVESVSQFLASRGIAKGDRVLLVSENSLFWVAAYLGILRAGAVAVPLPPSQFAADLADIVSTTEPKAAFVQASVATPVETLLGDVPVVVDQRPSGGPGGSNRWSFEDLAALRQAAPYAGPAVHVDEEHDLASLMFTSGSTGRPRGVMVSHRNIIANTTSIIQYMGLTASDRVMVVLPFYYCFGASLLHTHLRVGGSLVLDHRFMFPDRVLQRMQQTQCTGFAGVPSHYQILLRKSNLKKMSFPDLRYVQQSGGHLAPLFIRELRAALPGTTPYIMYGLTEATTRLSYLPPQFLDSKLGSIGKGIPGVTLEVLGKDGLPVGPGNAGEIVARGPNITRGYWRAPEETAAYFRDGKLHTGDLATVDADGFLYIVDRLKDFLKCGGNRVSCKQIEEMLLEVENVVEAAVVGMPHEVFGEAVKAFIVPRDRKDGELLRSAITSHCAQHFPQHLIPQEIVLVDQLPKNSAGKVMRWMLKEEKVAR